jgi:SAM-dependent methyltransferase
LTVPPWRIVEPDLDSILREHPRPLDELAAGEIPAVVLRGAFPSAKCEALVRRLIEEGLLYDPRLPIPPQFLEAAIPEGYYREGKKSEPAFAWEEKKAAGKTRIDVGTSLGYRGSDKEAFLAHSAQTNALFARLFGDGDNPIRLLYQTLERLSRDQRVMTAREPDGREYGAAIIRAHYGGYTYKPHFDSVRLREKREGLRGPPVRAPVRGSAGAAEHAASATPLPRRQELGASCTAACGRRRWTLHLKNETFPRLCARAAGSRTSRSAWRRAIFTSSTPGRFTKSPAWRESFRESCWPRSSATAEGGKRFLCGHNHEQFLKRETGPTMSSPLKILDPEAAVASRYAAAAHEVEPALCCPTGYPTAYLDVIPEEILAKDYGCGDPTPYVKPGETVLDLGAGAGKLAFILAQVVGPQGRVIGVDCNGQMLALARKHAPAVAEQLGFANMEFRNGLIQDLRLDLDRLAAELANHPVRTVEDWLALRSTEDRLRREFPLVDGESVDCVVSNCVLNLVRPQDRQELFAELFRVLREGGRAAISDIVADRDVPPRLQNDPSAVVGLRLGRLPGRPLPAGFPGGRLPAGATGQPPGDAVAGGRGNRIPRGDRGGSQGGRGEPGPLLRAGEPLLLKVFRIGPIFRPRPAGAEPRRGFQNKVRTLLSF